MDFNGENFEKNEPAFRVSVSLSQFFKDERALCYMSVQGHRPVRSLRRRLRRLFGPALPRRVFLLSRGHLLPPDEPLSVLRPDDLVEVLPMPVSCNWYYEEKLSQKSSELLANDMSDNVCDEDNHSKKRKHNTTENTELEVKSSTEGNSIIMTDTYVTEDCDTTLREDDTTDGINCTVPVQLEGNDLRQVKEHALALLQNYETKSQVIVDTAHERKCTKRVRRRVRRRKPRPTDTTCDVNFETPSTDISEQCSTTSVKSQPLVALSTQLPTSESVASEIPVLNSSHPSTPDQLPQVSAASSIIRNDAAVSRKARVVRPLDTDIHNMLTHKLSQDLINSGIETKFDCDSEVC